MKKIVYYTFITVSAWIISSCDSGFDELNTDKTRPTAIDPAFELNNAVLGFRTYSSLIYDMGIVQQIISPNSGVLTGANYNQDNRDASDDMWHAYFRDVIRYTRDVTRLTESVPERSNLYNMTRILQACAFLMLADAYGDIPYSEGGKGYPDGVFFPAYDSQQDVYTDIIAELTAATAALNAAGRIETADVLYGGNIDKWKKFGNSLLLRAGMRLSKGRCYKSPAGGAGSIPGWCDYQSGR
ncbi:MAG: SusD/RagB family nutrient-binding outer membrane lipoprotein [Cyclobacteriaceae bacterium]|nr:SusD/RagB family nutrient-binding outer membrane lipoprotein [Cyclobacteriaceae bacterium]